ncbi:MAG: hypothetical protein LT082_08780 [Comamonas sp.]|nr:hypothetical protein [Comamonas sp.]
MKTRSRTFPQGFGFEYQEPGVWPARWRAVGGDLSPRTWPAAAQRDSARACFTHRRSVPAALADLERLDARVADDEGAHA